MYSSTINITNIFILIATEVAILAQDCCCVTSYFEFKFRILDSSKTKLYLS